MDTQKVIKTFIGEKIGQSQRFDDKGKRIPVTVIEANPCNIIQIKNISKDGYDALQVGYGVRKSKNITKPVLGHIKKAGTDKMPRFLREFRIEKGEGAELPFKQGDVIKVGEVFTVGDMVDVSGTSRGKGFTGVVKRHHFKGGPRTHGQSDRERAPGSIGQTTTPGRVYKGKRMAGRSGAEKVTIKNLKVIEVDNNNNRLTVVGLVPGVKNSLLTIAKAN